MTRWLRAFLEFFEFFFGYEPELCGRSRNAVQLILCGEENETLQTINLTIGGPGARVTMRAIVGATGVEDTTLSGARFSLASPDIVESLPQAYLDGGSAGTSVIVRPGSTAGVVRLYAQCDSDTGDGVILCTAEAEIVVSAPEPPNADTLELVIEAVA